MRLNTTLLAVTDMVKSKHFYEEVLRCTISMNLDEQNVVFVEGFSLQSMQTWPQMIRRDAKMVSFGGNNLGLVFEVEDIDDLMTHLAQFPKIKYLHEVIEMPWAQRVVRFYDPDQNIIEVGEQMAAVCKRFLNQGLGLEEVSIITMMPLEYITSLD
jgi:catechol 2,3-dioxygenase-like lactoylglutathione lyase family enzyme